MDRMLAMEGTHVNITVGMDREDLMTLDMRDKGALTIEAEKQEKV